MPYTSQMTPKNELASVGENPATPKFTSFMTPRDETSKSGRYVSKMTPTSSWYDQTIGAFSSGAAETAGLASRFVGGIIPGEDPFEQWGRSLDDYVKNHPEYQPEEVQSVFDLITNPRALAGRVSSGLAYLTGSAALFGAGAIAGAAGVAAGPAAAIGAIGLGTAVGLTAMIEGRRGYESAIEDGQDENTATKKGIATAVVNTVLQSIPLHRLFRVASGAQVSISKAIISRVMNRVEGTLGKAEATAGIKEATKFIAFQTAVGTLGGSTDDLISLGLYGKPLPPEYFDKIMQNMVTAGVNSEAMGFAFTKAHEVFGKKGPTTPELPNLEKNDAFSREDLWKKAKDAGYDDKGALHLVNVGDAFASSLGERDGISTEEAYAKLISKLESGVPKSAVRDPAQIQEAVGKVVGTLDDLPGQAEASLVKAKLIEKGVTESDLVNSGTMDLVNGTKVLKKEQVIQRLRERGKMVGEAIHGPVDSARWDSELQVMEGQLEGLGKLLQSLSKPGDKGKAQQVKDKIGEVQKAHDQLFNQQFQGMDSTKELILETIGKGGKSSKLAKLNFELKQDVGTSSPRRFFVIRGLSDTSPQSVRQAIFSAFESGQNHIALPNDPTMTEVNAKVVAEVSKLDKGAVYGATTIGGESVIQAGLTPKMKMKLFEKIARDGSLGNRGSVRILESGQAILDALQTEPGRLMENLFQTFRRVLEPAENQVLGDWVGVKDGNWTPKDETKITRAFLKYLKDGSAPSMELAPTFDYFKKFITKVYGRLKGLGANSIIPEEVRGVFDRMFVQDSSPITAKRIEIRDIDRRIEGLGKKEEGKLGGPSLTPEEVTKYHDMAEAATGSPQTSMSTVWTDELIRQWMKGEEASELVKKGVLEKVQGGFKFTDLIFGKERETQAGRNYLNQLPKNKMMVAAKFGDTIYVSSEAVNHGDLFNRMGFDLNKPGEMGFVKDGKYSKAYDIGGQEPSSLGKELKGTQKEIHDLNGKLHGIGFELFTAKKKGETAKVEELTKTQERLKAEVEKLKGEEAKTKTKMGEFYDLDPKKTIIDGVARPKELDPPTPVPVDKTKPLPKDLDLAVLQHERATAVDELNRLRAMNGDPLAQSEASRLAPTHETLPLTVETPKQSRFRKVITESLTGMKTWLMSHAADLERNPGGQKYLELLAQVEVDKRSFAGDFENRRVQVLDKLSKEDNKFLTETDADGFSGHRKLTDRGAIPEKNKFVGPLSEGLAKYVQLSNDLWRESTRLAVEMRTLRRLSGDRIEPLRLSAKPSAPRHPTERMYAAVRTKGGEDYNALVKKVQELNPGIEIKDIISDLDRTYGLELTQERDFGALEQTRKIKYIPDTVEVPSGGTFQVFHVEPRGTMTRTIDRYGQRLGWIRWMGQGMLQNVKPQGVVDVLNALGLVRGGKEGISLNDFGESALRQLGLERKEGKFTTRKSQDVIAAGLEDKGVDIGGMKPKEIRELADKLGVPTSITVRDVVELLKTMNPLQIGDIQFKRLQRVAQEMKGVTTDRTNKAQLLRDVVERASEQVEPYLVDKLRRLHVNGGGDERIFNEVNALAQGIPLYTRSQTGIAKLGRLAGSILGSMQTSLAAIPNFPQTLTQLPQLGGYAEYLKAWQRVARNPQLAESDLAGMGAFRRAVMVWPREPAMNLDDFGRGLGSAVAKGTLQMKMANLNNLVAGEFFRGKAEYWRDNGITSRDMGVLKFLGLTDGEVQKIRDKGLSSDQRLFKKIVQNGVAKSQFVTEAPYLKAKIENHPVTSMIFNYMSYVNGTIKANLDVGKALVTARGKDILPAVQRAAALVSGIYGAGVISSILRQAMKGDFRQLKSEDSEVDRAMGAFAEAGLYGPVQRTVSAFNYDSGETERAIVGMMPHVSAMVDLFNAAIGRGKFGDFTPGRRLEEAVFKNTPLAKSFRNWIDKAAYPDKVEYDNARMDVSKFEKTGLNRVNRLTAATEYNPDYYPIFEAVARNDMERALEERSKFIEKVLEDGKDVGQELDNLRASLRSRSPINLSKDVHRGEAGSAQLRFLTSLSPERLSNHLGTQSRYMALVNLVAPR